MSKQKRAKPRKSQHPHCPAQLFQRIVELFDGNDEAARAWFRGPNRSLEGRTPEETVKSARGEAKLEQLLGRLEHGVFS
jgi:uncharacterized protein (DUF2384 family)